MDKEKVKDRVNKEIARRADSIIKDCQKFMHTSKMQANLMNRKTDDQDVFVFWLACRLARLELMNESTSNALVALIDESPTIEGSNEPLIIETGESKT